MIYFLYFDRLTKKVLSQASDLNFRLSDHLETRNPLPKLRSG